MPTKTFGIWLFAFGYFACYVPYTAVAKGVSKGTLPGLEYGLGSVQMLPMVALTALLAFVGIVTACGWWSNSASVVVAGIRVPVPSRITVASGLATAVTGIATTLAYTFADVSILFMMLLMRGGVLVMAPVVDVISRKRIHGYSVVALGLCLLALIVTFLGSDGFAVSSIALVDVACYLGAYFLRLQLMSRAGKVVDLQMRRRFFVEEQMVSSGAIVIALAAIAWLHNGTLGTALAEGFGLMAFNMTFVYLVVIGLAALGTGVFGALVLLDPREHSFAVPVNRSSSILSGAVAMVFLALFANGRLPSDYEWAGFALIIASIAFLTIPTALQKRRGLARGIR